MGGTVVIDSRPGRTVFTAAGGAVTAAIRRPRERFHVETAARVPPVRATWERRRRPLRLEDRDAPWEQFVAIARRDCGSRLAPRSSSATDRAHGRRRRHRRREHRPRPARRFRAPCPCSATASTRRRSTPGARPASSRSTPISAPTRRPQGVGSGFVVDRTGTILTNAHVVTNVADAAGGAVRGAQSLYVEFKDRDRVPAREDRRLGRVRRRRRDQGRSRCARPGAGAARQLLGRRRSATPSPRSAARSTSRARSRSASSRPPIARSTRSPRATASRTRSRRMRRSTAATRAARSSTRRGA